MIVAQVPLTFWPNANAHEIVLGRTGLGVPYAHVVYGSAIQRSVLGATLGHALARAIRWYRKHGRHLEGTPRRYGGDAP